MADQWFCVVAGVQYGPFSGAQLKSLAAAGRLSPDDSVLHESTGQWVKATHVGGLFQANTPATIGPGANHPLQEASARAKQRPILRAKPVQTHPHGHPSKASSRGAGGPPPPLPGAAERAAAPPQIAASSDSPGEGLGFLEEAYAAAPPSAALGQVPRADPFSRMKNPKILLWILLGLLGLLAVLVVVLFIINREGPQLRDARAADESDQRAARDAVAEKNAAAGEAAPKKDKASKAPEPETIRWIDTSREAWIGSNVTLRVLGAELGYPKVFSAAGEVLVPKEPCLIVRLQLINRATTASVKYSGWTGPSSVVRLTDQGGKEYPMQTFGAGAVVEGQQKAPADIGPQASIQDVLVFTRPDEGVTSLRLVLPGGPIEDQQSARLEIPKAMITVLAKPKPKAAPPKTPAAPGPSVRSVPGQNGSEPTRTGDPAKDFGIEGVEEMPKPDAKPPASP